MTNQYYDENAEGFFNTTYQVEMDALYAPFLEYLPRQGHILDLGCGSGRDSLAFKKLGYTVTAMDLSAELVKKATQLTGLKVQQKSFYDLDEIRKYDGIWACASLLHCERHRLDDVLQKMTNALKSHGVMYLSFKYGDSDREQDGRKFTDLNEEQTAVHLKNNRQLKLLNQWITEDQRPDRNERWLNLLIQKMI